MNLSQEEIDALLNGGKTDDDDPGDDTGNAVPAAEVAEEVADVSLTDEDLAAAVAAANATSSTPDATFGPRVLTAVHELDVDTAGPEYTLNSEETDTIGEIGNICMGAVATTMYTLLDRRVSITTPRVSVHFLKQVLPAYQTPFVVVEVEYTEGITGKNLLVLKEHDAALITDVLMGGEGKVEDPIELTELHMSAINEIMNQMIGASATALSKILEKPVNISPPLSNRVDVMTDISAQLDFQSVVIKISFEMEIDGLLKSQLLQLIPYDLGREMAKNLAPYIAAESETASMPAAAAQAPAVAAVPAPAMPPSAAAVAPPPAPTPAAAYPPPMAPAYPAAAPYPQPYPSAYPPPAPPPSPGNLVDVRPIQYNSFDSHQTPPPAEVGMQMVHDIPLQVAVELGKTKRQISDILNFGMGTVVVLDKLMGDPVEILVNGKLIARGEVVVIEENYGVRITEITTS